MQNNLKTHFNDWLFWIDNEKRLSKNTILSYRTDIESLFVFLQRYYNSDLDIKIISRLDDEDLSGWLFDRLKKEVSHRSNARALSSFKSFLNYLIKKKIIKNSKILKIKGPKFLESLPRPLSNKQVLKIIDKIKEEKVKWIKMRNLSVIILMWGYGLRISEVLNLVKKDLYTEELRIMGKGRKIRIIPVATELIGFIKLMLKESNFNFELNDSIFKGKKGGKLKPEIIQRLIRKIRKEIILPDNTTPHSLRHTFATELLHNFVDLRSIQELLGHSSLSTTQKYTEVNSDYLRNVLEKNHPRAK